MLVAVVRLKRIYCLNKMLEIVSNPIFWIVFSAISEIVALTPLKSNSIVELLLAAVKSIKPTEVKK